MKRAAIWVLVAASAALAHANRVSLTGNAAADFADTSCGVGANSNRPKNFGVVELLDAEYDSSGNVIFSGPDVGVPQQLEEVCFGFFSFRKLK